MKIGDVVFLKSGSPAMTIIDAPTKKKQPTTVGVVWYVPETGICEAFFPAEILTDNLQPLRERMGF